MGTQQTCPRCGGITGDENLVSNNIAKCPHCGKIWSITASTEAELDFDFIIPDEPDYSIDNKRTKHKRTRSNNKTPQSKRLLLLLGALVIIGAVAVYLNFFVFDTQPAPVIIQTPEPTEAPTPTPTPEPTPSPSPTIHELGALQLNLEHDYDVSLYDDDTLTGRNDQISFIIRRELIDEDNDWLLTNPDDVFTLLHDIGDTYELLDVVIVSGVQALCFRAFSEPESDAYVIVIAFIHDSELYTFLVDAPADAPELDATIIHNELLSKITIVYDDPFGYEENDNGDNGVDVVYVS